MSNTDRPWGADTWGQNSWAGNPTATLYSGWGSGTWGQTAWGEDQFVVLVTGVEAEGAIGKDQPWSDGYWGQGSWGTPLRVGVTANALSSPQGVECVGGIGTSIVDGEANHPVTSVAGAGAIGDVVVNAGVDAAVTGVESDGVIGTVTTAAGAGVLPVGVEAVGATTVNYDGPAFTADGTAQLSTAQAKFGSASLLLDGTDDFVTSDENIDLSSGNFTVDMWIRPTSVTGYKGLWQSGTSSLLNVYLIGNQVQGTVAGSTTLFLSSTRISANVWTMISVEREGNVHRLYINGVLEQSSSTGNRPDDGVFAIGKNGFGDFNGYIDETRLSTVARYGGTSFTEPTTAFPLDTDTTALLHFDGANGSTDIVNAAKDGIIVSAVANVPVTGVEAVGGVGDVTATGDATAEPTGVEANGDVGDVFISLGIVVSVTGLQGNAKLGTVVVSANADVPVVGLAATGIIGFVNVWGEVDDDQTPNWTPIASTQSPSWDGVSETQNPNWQDIAA